MTMLRALRRSADVGLSAENPGVPLTSTVLMDMLGRGGRTNAGVAVTETSSLTMPAVWRAVNLIGGTAASLPLHAYRNDNDARVLQTGGQGAELLANPHPDLTPFELWEIAYAHVALWGNAYLQMLRDQTGAVRELWPIDPRKVRVGRDKSYRKWFEIDGQPYSDQQILHIPGFGYDGVCGVSPIRMARQGVGLALAAEEYGGKLFSNGSLASGVLQTEQRLEEDQAEALKARWKARNSGLGNAHEVAVLDSGASFHPLTINPDDAQFLETRRFQVVEIARMFGIPPHMLMEVSGSTSWGTGIEQQSIGFVTFTLRPWLTRFEQRLSKLISPSTVYVKYSVDGLLRGDIKTRFTAYAMGRQWGWYSINDIRRLEDLAPLAEGGDTYLQPMNMSDVANPVAFDDPAADPAANSDLQAQIDEIKAALAA